MSDDRYRHKWWGWGPEGIEYEMDGRPDFWPWIAETAHFEPGATMPPRIQRESIELPDRRINETFEQTLSDFLKPHQVRTDDDDRMTHAYGRGYRDLVRLRAGKVTNPPDLVLYPESHGDVVAIVKLANRQSVNLIAFGGGTNIVGSVEPKRNTGRLVATLDMRRMNRMLSLDRESMTADLEPGMFGPQVEEALNAQGFTLGHHPDSFVYSTLGGWLATRSAGTQSNIYGKIEDMVVSMTLVTPAGTVETKTLPAASNGPDVNRLIVGSEGTFGIITRATMKVHKIPEWEQYRLLLFPSFKDGFEAVHECVSSGLMPSLARLSDERETELIFAAKPRSSALTNLIQSPIKKLLAARGYHHPAALIVAFEGNKKPTKQLKSDVMRVLKKHRAFDLGTGGGEAWKVSRYDIPYLRDYMMNYGLVADSFETSTVWSNVWQLYGKARQRLEEALEEVTGFTGFVGCHISHLYHTGACIYYTIGVRSREGSEVEDWGDQYAEIKRIATRTFMDCGGALSHHHGVGTEHQPWVEEELSPLAVASLREMKKTLDPEGIMNPGVLFPPAAATTTSATSRQDGRLHV